MFSIVAMFAQDILAVPVSTVSSESVFSSASDSRELYNVVSRGVFGDSVGVVVMMEACLTEERAEEAEMYFREAKARGMELDASAYCIAIQAICKKPNSREASEL